MLNVIMYLVSNKRLMQYLKNQYLTKSAASYNLVILISCNLNKLLHFANYFQLYKLKIIASTFPKTFQSSGK